MSKQIVYLIQASNLTHNFVLLTQLGFLVYQHSEEQKFILNSLNIDYVAHDLKMLEAWCLPIILHEIPIYKGYEYVSGIGKNNYEPMFETFEYQPKVICVFADDCFKQVLDDCDCNHDRECIKCPKFWDSSGVYRKYQFAQAHHIKCIRLSELLENKKIEECEML